MRNRAFGAYVGPLGPVGHENALRKFPSAHVEKKTIEQKHARHSTIETYLANRFLELFHPRSVVLQAVERREVLSVWMLRHDHWLSISHTHLYFCTSWTMWYVFGRYLCLEKYEMEHSGQRAISFGGVDAQGGLTFVGSCEQIRRERRESGVRNL